MAVNPACRTFVPLLSPYVDGELSPGDRVTVERHLSACKDCTARAADLRAEAGLVRLGMEMLADEVDFKDFSQKVMARLTPERPPLWERLRLSLSEMFTYQRGMLVSSLAGAAAVLLVVLPLLLRQGRPEGYASEKMVLQSLSTDESAKVSPVVLETPGGDAIIWMVEKRSDAGQDDESSEEELDGEPGAISKPGKPKGGEL